LIATAIPLLVTGGFHVDGYMDTMDAFHSYQPRERKLEILKDAHIGAFSVLMLAALGLLYVAGFAQITDCQAFQVFCCGFFFARCLSGLSVVSFRSAKSDGILYRFASSAHRRVVKGALYGQLLLCGGFMCYFSWKAAILVMVAALVSFAYYRWRSYRELGGITGDTAGYFLSICECAMVLAAAVASLC
jgi:adenosylcobinamide-GDP ribazoletransferase